MLQAVSDGKYPISPTVAVGWHFAPIFNLYWVVKWARDVNRFGSGTDRGPIFRGTVIGLLS